MSPIGFVGAERWRRGSPVGLLGPSFDGALGCVVEVVVIGIAFVCRRYVGGFICCLGSCLGGGWSA